MKSSIFGACTHRLLLLIDAFGILMSMFALIICGSRSSFFVSVNFGLGSTTNGELHVIASLVGTFSKISFFMPSSSHFLSGFCRW